LERNDTFLGGSTCLHLNRLADNILKKGNNIWRSWLNIIWRFNAFSNIGRQWLARLFLWFSGNYIALYLHVFSIPGKLLVQECPKLNLNSFYGLFRSFAHTKPCIKNDQRKKSYNHVLVIFLRKLVSIVKSQQDNTGTLTASLQHISE
jgi:hypothetical protein